MLELGPDSESFHRQLGQRIASAGVHRLIAVGQFAEAGADSAAGAGLADSAITRLDTTESLLARAGELLKAGDLVLLKGSRGMALERVIEALEKGVTRK